MAENTDCEMRNDVRAPSKWAQNVLSTQWWLAALQVINLTPNVSGWNMTKTTKTQNTFFQNAVSASLWMYVKECFFSDNFMTISLWCHEKAENRGTEERCFGTEQAYGAHAWGSAALWGVFTPELSGLVKMDSGAVSLWVRDICNRTAIGLGCGSEQHDPDLLEEVVLRIVHCWSKPPPSLQRNIIIITLL